MTIPARKNDLQVIHYIALTLTYSNPNGATGVQIGTLPAGAVPITTTIDVNTAFNATSTNTISVGTTLTGTDYVSAQTASSQATSATAVPIAKRAPLTTDTPIYCSYAQTGTAATAGSATIHVSYIPSVS